MSKDILPNNPLIGIEELISEEKKFSSNVFSKQDIFEIILNSLEPIDFEKIKSESEKKLKKQDVLVLIIEELKKSVDSICLGLCCVNDKVYLYNKSYWINCEKNETEDFLSNVAERFGLSETDAKYFRFKENLFEQFKSETRNVNLSLESNLINLKNGTLEINEGSIKLREFRREDFLTYQLPFNYETTAKAPQFSKFLNEVLPDTNLQKVLSEFIGSIFVPNETLKIEKALFLYGTGANGKSVVYEIIEALLGYENIASVSLQKLTTDANARTLIENKLLNYSSEIGEVGDFGVFKQLTSREPVITKVLYKDQRQMRNYARLMFNCNDLPKKNEHTDGYFRRFILIPFEKTISEEKQDKKLAQRIIQSELSGVLNWVLEGMLRLLNQKKFTFCEKSEKLKNKFRLESDSVMMFTQDCQIEKSSTKTLLSDIYARYREFCLPNGFKQCARTTFSTRLSNLGFEKKRTNMGIAFYAEFKK